MFKVSGVEYGNIAKQIVELRELVFEIDDRLKKLEELKENSSCGSGESLK